MDLVSLGAVGVSNSDSVADSSGPKAQDVAFTDPGFAAFNLAPFAGSNGMMMLEGFIEAMRGEPVNEDAKQSYYQLSLLVIFVLLAFWIVGLAGWVWDSL